MKISHDSFYHLFTNKFIIAFTLITSILSFLINFIMTLYCINNLSISFTLICFFSLLAILFIIINYFCLIVILKFKNTQITNLESHNNTLSDLYDNVRSFKHEFNNIIDLIGGFIYSNDLTGLKNYYSSLRNDCININNSETLNPHVFNNPGIYGLIVSKYQKASKLNVNISLEVFFDFNNIHISIYDFSKILGILLDNAIDAASECDNKEVRIMFRESQKNRMQIIDIENTYKDKNIDTKVIFEKGYSSKDKHMGIGLWEVNKIIKENNNTVLHTSKDDTFFKQHLEIYY